MYVQHINVISMFFCFATFYGNYVFPGKVSLLPYLYVRCISAGLWKPHIVIVGMYWHVPGAFHVRVYLCIPYATASVQLTLKFFLVIIVYTCIYKCTHSGKVCLLLCIVILLRKTQGVTLYTCAVCHVHTQTYLSKTGIIDYMHRYGAVCNQLHLSWV